MGRTRTVDRWGELRLPLHLRPSPRYDPPVGGTRPHLLRILLGVLLVLVAILVLCTRPWRPDDAPIASATTPGQTIQPRQEHRQESTTEPTISSTAPDGSLSPTRPACISHGTVSLEDGDPVAGAEIHIYQAITAQKVMGYAPHVWAPTGLQTESPVGRDRVGDAHLRG